MPDRLRVEHAPERLDDNGNLGALYVLRSCAALAGTGPFYIDCAE